MRVLTPAAMAEADRRAIEELGVPSLVLMENAALAVVEAATESYPEAESAAVFCGPGNNGGDGLAVARHLAVRGFEVSVFVVAGGRELSPDAARQRDIVRKMGLAPREVAPDASPAELAQAAARHDLVIDALYGTGLARPLAGQAAALVEALNEGEQPRVAVDLPSGLAGDRGALIGPHVIADSTVTFGALKVAHVLLPAAAACGRLAIADLGVPPDLLEAGQDDLHLLVGEELAAGLPARPPSSHKGDFGHVLLVAGSTGKAGAAALAARGAVRSGAGLVTVAVPEPVLPSVAASSLESMSLPLPAGERGELTLAAVGPALAAAAARDVLALGPGLGEGEEVREAARRIALGSAQPAVLDADALNAFAGRPEDLRARAGATVLTPHPGELGRLLGITTGEVVADRLAALRQAVERTAAHVVLKGHQTLVGTPQGAVFVNPTGNAGMASGGMGDVLTGFLAGLLAQGLSPPEACCLAVFLHGLAGDLAATAQGGASLVAGDLLAALPAAFRRLREA